MDTKEGGEPEMTRLILTLLIAMVLLPAFGMADSTNPLSVTLAVKENAGVARNEEPVTSGISIPKEAAILSTQNLAIFDEDNKEIPAQFRVLARWHGAPGDSSKPIKWLLIDFEASVSAHGLSTYHLRSGGSGSSGSALAEYNTPDVITVNTGPLKFTVNKNNFRIFDTVSIDLNGNGLFEQDEEIVSSNADNGSMILDTDGINDNISSNDALSDTIFSTYHRNPSEFEIEENGPLKTVISIKGRYTSINGVEHMKYATRIYAYKGKTYLRVRHSYANGLLYDSWQQSSNDFSDDETTDSITIDFTLNLDSKNYLLETEKGNTLSGTLNQGETVFVQQEDTNTIGDLTYIVDTNGQTSTTLGNAEGYGDLSDQSKGLTISQRYFWQKYPKRMTVTGDGKISLGLVPVKDRLREAVGVGNEIMFYFHGNDRSQISNLVYGFNKNPLFAVASSAWYVDSGAFGVLEPSPSGKYPKFDSLLASNYDISISDEARLKLYGATNFGGHCFDCKYDTFSNVDNTLWAANYYDALYQMMHQFARTADLKYYVMGSQYTQHYMETDIYNIYPGYARYGADGSKSALYGLSPSYRAEHRKDPHFVHNFGLGLTYYYYLSGDERASEIYLRGADSLLPRSDLGGTGRGGQQKASWILGAYLLTYDSKYIDALTSAVSSRMNTYDSSYFESGISIRQEMGLYVPFLYDLYDTTKDTVYKDGIVRLADWAMTTGYIASDNNFWHYYPSQKLLYWTSKMEFIPGFGFAYLASKDPKYLEFVEPFFAERLTERNDATDGWAKGSQAFRNTIHLQGILSKFYWGSPPPDSLAPNPPSNLRIFP
jgi:hypothetical protein